MYVYGLPNYTGRTIYGSSSNINGLVAAGLPNIEGQFGRGRTTVESTGVFESRIPSDRTSNSGTSTDGTIIHFSASRYNSIYGASTTVQPLAVKCAVLVRHD